MTLIVVTRVPASLRGQLTRWLLEIKPGVFLGSVSARVRERLWAMVLGRKRLGACALVADAPNEQGFTIVTAGDDARSVVDLDGLQLVRRAVSS